MTGTLIVSTGRCGSTLMSDLMNLHPSVLSLSEFFTMVGPGLLRAPDMDGPALWEKMCFVSQQAKDLMRLSTSDEILADISGGEPYPEPLELITIPHLARTSPGPNHAVFRSAVLGQPLAPIREHFAKIFDELAHLFNRECWVERSGATMDYLDLLLPCFLDARVIHIHRDGRETALSMQRHPYFQMRAVYSRVRPMPVAEVFKHTLTAVQFGHYWSDMMVKGLKALERDGRPVLHLSYEDLAANTTTELCRVFDFMGVAVSDRYLKDASAIVQEPRLRWHEFSMQERLALSDACEPGMEAVRKCG